MCFITHLTDAIDLRGQDGLYYEKSSFYMILKMKIVSAGIQTTDSWVIGRALYQWAFWLVSEWAWNNVYQIPMSLFTHQSSVRTCLKITYCEQFQIQCCVKIAVTLTLDTKDIFLIQELHQEGNLNVLLFWVEISWLRVAINGACCSN